MDKPQAHAWQKVKSVMDTLEWQGRIISPQLILVIRNESLIPLIVQVQDSVPVFVTGEAERCVKANVHVTCKGQPDTCIKSRKSRA